MTTVEDSGDVVGAVGGGAKQVAQLHVQDAGEGIVRVISSRPWAGVEINGYEKLKTPRLFLPVLVGAFITQARTDIWRWGMSSLSISF